MYKEKNREKLKSEGFITIPKYILDDLLNAYCGSGEFACYEYNGDFIEIHRYGIVINRTRIHRPSLADVKKWT